MKFLFYLACTMWWCLSSLLGLTSETVTVANSRGRNDEGRGDGGWGWGGWKGWLVTLPIRVEHNIVLFFAVEVCLAFLNSNLIVNANLFHQYWVPSEIYLSIEVFGYLWRLVCHIVSYSEGCVPYEGECIV